MGAETNAMTVDSVASGGESVLNNVIITPDCIVYKGRVYTYRSSQCGFWIQGRRVYVPMLWQRILCPRKKSADYQCYDRGFCIHEEEFRLPMLWPGVLCPRKKCVDYQCYDSGFCVHERAYQCHDRGFCVQESACRCWLPVLWPAVLCPRKSFVDVACQSYNRWFCVQERIV